MLKIEKFVTPSPEQWEITIEGMRNAMNSWDKMDSYMRIDPFGEGCGITLGEKDRDLMMRLNNGGAPHAKYRRMLPVHVTVNAPLYWWKEFETYRIGVASNPSDIEFNSCSTMHKIHAKEFTIEDFSTEHLLDLRVDADFDDCPHYNGEPWDAIIIRDISIKALNFYRNKFKETNESDEQKKYWWQMIQLLPSSYNQKRTIYRNYQVLYEIYEWRKGHKLDEWHTFCHWIEELPNSEIITGEVV